MMDRSAACECDSSGGHMFDERGASKTHEALCLLVHMCSACSLQTRRFGFVAEKGEESISVKSLMKRNTWRWGSNRMDICIYIYIHTIEGPLGTISHCIMLTEMKTSLAFR